MSQQENMLLLRKKLAERERGREGGQEGGWKGLGWEEERKKRKKREIGGP